MPAIEDDEPRAVLRGASEVLDERPPAEGELQRVDRVRVLDEHREALRHGERVDVGRAPDRELRDDAIVLDQAVGGAADHVDAHRERPAVVAVGVGETAGGDGRGFETPSVSSVSGSNATGIGVSVSATHLPMIFATLTLPLSVNAGSNRLATRWKALRHGSVANSL